MKADRGLTYKDDDLGFWPNLMDTVDKTVVSLGESGTCDVVCVVVVICSEVDDYEVGGCLFGEIPPFWLLPPDLESASRGVRCAIPLIFLGEVWLGAVSIRERAEVAYAYLTMIIVVASLIR